MLAGKGSLDISFLEKSCDRRACKEMPEKSM